MKTNPLITLLVVLLSIICVLAVSLGTSALIAHVATDIWLWFVVPFGYDKLPFWMAFGILGIWGLIRIPSTVALDTKFKKLEKNNTEDLGTEISRAVSLYIIIIFTILFTWLVAWIISGFVG